MLVTLWTQSGEYYLEMSGRMVWNFGGGGWSLYCLPVGFWKGSLYSVALWKFWGHPLWLLGQAQTTLIMTVPEKLNQKNTFVTGDRFWR